MEELITIDGITVRVPGGVIVTDDGRVFIPAEVVLPQPVE